METQSISVEERIANLTELQIEILRMVKLTELACEPFTAYLMHMALADVTERVAILTANQT